jgi:hypothetical protein
MECNRDQPFDPTHPPRRFVYRSADRETNLAHPRRRATDTPHPIEGVSGQPSSGVQILKFRVHLRIH